MLRALLIGLIRGYQLTFGRFVGARCRFYPSCSEYALEAVRTSGALRGTGLAVWRVVRCAPWSSGGVDHPPGSVHAGG